MCQRPVSCVSNSTRDLIEDCFQALAGLEEILCCIPKKVFLSENLKCYVGRLRVDGSRKGRSHLLISSRVQ